MKLPPLPPLLPKLGCALPALPQRPFLASPDMRRPEHERAGKLTVTKLAYDRLELRCGAVVEVLDRGEVFRLIGMLERVGSSL